MHIGNPVIRASLVAAVLAASCGSVRLAYAHNGGIIVQLQNGKLVTGLDNEQPGGSPDMDERVFSSLLRPDLYGQDVPSFLSLSNPPPETDPLPPGTDIGWDFLPMTIGGVTSNLFYWDGQGTTLQDVEFGVVPQANVTLGIYNVTDNESALIDGSSDMIAGALLGTTDSTGSGLRLHRHNWFLLDDGDGGIPPTVVPEGIYLIALQLRMEGYMTSEPFFVVPGTYELISESLESLNAAVSWVQQNVDSLILDGDYNFDGKVDAFDYEAWRAQFGSTGPWPINGDYADGNRDGTVDAADFVVWRKHLGASAAINSSAANFAASNGSALAAVPEPSILLTALHAAAIAMLCRRQRW